MLTFTFHTDAGHGWLEVSKLLAKTLQVKVSQFSYEKGDKLFLEEDCDAPAFEKACNDNNISFRVVCKHFEGNHPIRNYNRFTRF